MRISLKQPSVVSSREARQSIYMKNTFMISISLLYIQTYYNHIDRPTRRLFSVKFLCGEANIVTAQVRLLSVRKRKPKMFGLKTLMERGISGKILTFVIH